MKLHHRPGDPAVLVLTTNVGMVRIREVNGELRVALVLRAENLFECWVCKTSAYVTDIWPRCRCGRLMRRTVI